MDATPPSSFLRRRESSLTDRSAAASLTDEAIFVSVASLIQLAQPARGLSLRRGEIRSRKSDVLRSRMKGRGMEYDESRPYQPGDDVRYLDWRVTARTGKAHTKLFCEERERPVFLWIDCRATMFFATRGRLKIVAAAELAALLAWSAAQEGDRVGAVVFSENFHRELRPRRGRSSVLRLVHELAAANAAGPAISGSESDSENGAAVEVHSAGRAWSNLSRLVRPGSLVFAISDFREIDETGEALVRKLAAHNEVFFILVSDPVEEQLPPPGDYRVSDGARDLRFNTADAGFAETYSGLFRARVERWQGIARKVRASFLQCRTFESPLEMLKKPFGARVK